MFIGAPVIAPGAIDRSGSECRTALWKEVPFAYNIHNDCRKHQISADQVLDGGSSERSKHGGPVCDGHDVSREPLGRTCNQERDFGQKMEADNIEMISDLVSSTELCHITHNLQRPAETDGHHDYLGGDQYADVISAACPTISADTEFLTILTSSQLAVTSPETDGTKVANYPTSESETPGVLEESIPTGSASQEGFPCSSDLFADASDEELDQKSLKVNNTGEELAKKTLQSQKSKELDKKSFQSQKSEERFDKKSFQSQKSDEKCDKKSFQSQKGDEKLDKKSSQSRRSEESLLRIKGESAAEGSNVYNLGSASSKRKTALPGSSPSSKHEQRSKKSKPSTSPVTSPMKRNDDRQQTPAKPLTLLKYCSDKSKVYNIMVVVLQPCHVKEVKIKSGSNMGSTLPLATIDVMDQSEVKRKVLMWRNAAFWSLALLPGEIIELTNLSVSEDRWNEDLLLQSSFRSKLINLGSCSTLLPGETSCTVECSSVKALLDYIHTKHYYLSELSPRQPQRLDHVEYISLADLQPELLLHSVLKVNSISILKESTYSFKGLQQNKIILTVKQVEGQTSTLVLWGTCISWCDQIRLKRDHIWVFKHLFCKKNILSGDLELHTTPWSSCECLFDDDQRAIDFRKKYHLSVPKPMSLLTMIEDRYSGEIQVKGSISQMEFQIPGKCKILISHETSISRILKFLPDIIYTGCGKCKRELNIDDNHVYEQCFVCLPFNQVRVFYRSAQMTVISDGCCVRVQVPPDILENVFLNISPNLLPKAFPSCPDVTYGTIVADLCRSLLTRSGESFVFTIRSQFMLDENSIPLEEDFHLVDFHLDL